jgi:hypothetical protein
MTEPRPSSPANEYECPGCLAIIQLGAIHYCPLTAPYVPAFALPHPTHIYGWLKDCIELGGDLKERNRNEAIEWLTEREATMAKIEEISDGGLSERVKARTWAYWDAGLGGYVSSEDPTTLAQWVQKAFPEACDPSVSEGGDGDQ